ncbi:MAG: hypothetical protein KTR31_27740 [Myxococcales bacterium]|nr:hypothetical protein [Myxococcales bacterium]
MTNALRIAALAAVTALTACGGATVCDDAADLFADCIDATGTTGTTGTVEPTCDDGSLESCQAQCAVDNYVDGDCDSLLDLTVGADYFACVAGCAATGA